MDCASSRLHFRPLSIISRVKNHNGVFLRIAFPICHFAQWCGTKHSCHVAPSHHATCPQVSGLMLASHTSIRHLFSRGVSQYEKLMKKQAFLDNYRKFSMFAVSRLLLFVLTAFFLPPCSPTFSW